MEPSQAESPIAALPAETAEALRARLNDGEELLAAVRTDMLRTGRFGDAWLALTNRRLLCLGVEGDPRAPALEIALNDITMLKRRDMRGCCILEAHTIANAVAVAYFTRSSSAAFAQLTEKASPFVKQQAAAEPARPESGQRHGGDDGGGHHRHEWGHGGWHGGHGGWHGGWGHQDAPAGPPKTCAKCGKPIPHRIGVCPACIDKKRLATRLLGLGAPYVFPMSVGLVLMLLITGVEMAQPVLTKVLIDECIPRADYRLFVWIIAAIAGILLFSAVFSAVRGYIMAQLGERITHDLRRRVYGHVQSLSLDFYDQRQTGWIMDRVSADTGNLQNFLSEGFQDLIRDVMTILVIVVIMLAMSPSLTLVTLVPAPLVVFLTVRFLDMMHRVWHAAWRKRAYMTTHLANVIPGVRVVKAFAQEQREEERFGQCSREFMDAHVRAARASATFYPTISFSISLGFILVWSWGGYQVISGGTVTLGTLVAFISYLWRFYGPLSNLTRFGERAQRAFTSAQRIFDVLDTQATVADPADKRAMPRISGAVTFRNVTFGYEPTEPVLKDLTFSVEPGEMIGLVGPSGAGKSTTINLLCRFYDADQGTVEIDDIDVRKVTLKSLHQQIGVVLQEPFLFHGTIADNIAYGSPDAGREAIVRAARAANAHDFIVKFPDGYDTLAGERGQRLSGGERQRIAIARAILRDPRILILDEATSSVDTETEATIQEAIARLVQGRTTFAIAHRFSTLRNAHRLIVIEEGRIVEIGTHEELLAKEDGAFRRLVDLQTRNNQIVAVGG